MRAKPDAQTCAPPRWLRPSANNFTGLFAPQSLREKLFYEWQYNALHWGRGFAYYRIVPLVRRLLFTSKPAMRVRGVLVWDYKAG